MSKRALRRAGRLGDGWIETGSTTLDEVQERLDTVLAHRAAAGRESEPFEVTVSDQFGRDVDGVRGCEDIGATRVIISPVISERLSAEVIVDRSSGSPTR